MLGLETDRERGGGAPAKPPLRLAVSLSGGWRIDRRMPGRRYIDTYMHSRRWTDG